MLVGLSPELILFSNVYGNQIFTVLLFQVSHLVAVHAYVGVVEICLAAAAKRDPQGLALHYYKNMEPADDHQVSLAQRI